MKRLARSYDRFYFNKPLKSVLRITTIKNKPVHSNKTLILIHDISQDGLCFASHLKFPVEDIEVVLSLHIFGYNVKIKGNIIWRKNTGDSKYYYGVQLIQHNITFYRVIEEMKNRGFAVMTS